jgi:signal transduction histidine kinase/ActR/RegA family two-component response regulator
MSDAIPVTSHELVDDALHGVRVRVLHAALNVLAVGMPLISAVLILGALRAGTINRLTIVLAGSVLTYPVLWLARDRLGFRRSAMTLVGMLAVSALLLGSRGALTVGYAAIHMLTVLSASLFFGRRGAMVGIAIVLGTHTLAWGLVTSGILPPVSPTLWDPRNPAVWLRHFFVLGLLGAVIALTELHVVERLAHEVDVHRRLAEREMQQRLSLERAEREREYERDQRERAQHALEQARRLEALARMSGGIAHDFNNALTVIVGTAGVAKLSLASPEDVALYLDEIVQASKRAADLTNQLLTLGRQQISSPEPVEMTDLLGRLQGALRRVLADDISLIVDLPNEPVTARADAGGLERALYNLVLNARDAMPGVGGGTITVTCHYEAIAGRARAIADGRYVVVRVADTGHGIDPQTLERIFDPFFTTKSERGGTGLGLATVYAFAKESGGHVEVTSIEGQGTAFTLLLPEYCDAPHPDAPASKVAPLRVPVRDTGRILVVEDRADVRTTIVRTLTAHGFDVSEAGDGTTAVRLLSTGPDYALMCIDGVMPGMSTAAVIERAEHLTPAMRVLVCSGYVREDLLRRGVEAGRYAFLAKPFTAEQLLASVDGVLRSARSPPISS